jgi:hypothetical protein
MFSKLFASGKTERGAGVVRCIDLFGGELLLGKEFWYPPGF